MPGYTVNILFKGTDKMSAQVKRLEKRIKPLGNIAEKSFRKAGKQASLFSSILKSMLIARGISTGLSKLEQGVSTVVDEFVQMDHAVTSALNPP